MLLKFQMKSRQSIQILFNSNKKWKTHKSCFLNKSFFLCLPKVHSRIKKKYETFKHKWKNFKYNKKLHKVCQLSNKINSQLLSISWWTFPMLLNTNTLQFLLLNLLINKSYLKYLQINPTMNSLSTSLKITSNLIFLPSHFITPLL